MTISLQKLRNSFEEAGYICDENTALTVFLALELQKPLLIEGAPGVGKTEMGKVLAEILESELIRLQCYEGLDETKALYEWNYQRQLLRIQLNRELGEEQIREEDLFSDRYLLERPLLKAIRSEKRAVLLIDEVDKCDPEFEAFLFEVLSDFQVSIPELGTIPANNIPVVVLTSNNERELSDGLKRRCLYLYLDFPEVDKEVQIIKAKVPGIADRLAWETARVVAHLRRQADLRKKPSIAETLDWARALVSLNCNCLDGKTVAGTLNILLKTRADQQTFKQEIGIDGIDKTLSQGGNGGEICGCR
ncbi:MAG: AAA family ATPase [Dethiobacteria bacterium]|nr:MoxR family ATPase [Bacillota bacterium]MDW7729226.1 MoxR family ATPase [Bacillota bacterium]